MKKLIIPFFALATLYSCSNSDDDAIPVNPDEKYLNGFFITNEGNFGKADGSVSHLSADFNTVSNDIFKTSNGRGLGDVVQDRKSTRLNSSHVRISYAVFCLKKKKKKK